MQALLLKAVLHINDTSGRPAAFMMELPLVAYPTGKSKKLKTCIARTRNAAQSFTAKIYLLPSAHFHFSRRASADSNHETDG